MNAEVGLAFGAAVQNAELPGLSDGRSTTGGVTITPIDGIFFDVRDAESTLTRQFNVRELTGFALTGRPEAVRAAGGALRYAQDTQKAAAEHISGIGYFESQDSMILDAVTLRNLEIVETRGEVAGRSLFSVIDETITSMGARLLKGWLVRPSIKRHEIQHDSRRLPNSATRCCVIAFASF
jgi:DNA mismatch repair protein MutS